MEKDLFKIEKLAVKFLDQLYPDASNYVRGVACSAFQTGASIFENQNEEANDILLELAQLTKHRGEYLKTWGNGTEEYAPALYSEEEVALLVDRAFKLCYHLEEIKQGFDELAEEERARL